MVIFHPENHIEFRAFLPSSDKVELMGTFTGWRENPAAMTKLDSGWFVTRIRLDPGDHEFQYFVDGCHWLADYSASGVRLNDFGLWVSQLYLPEDEPVRLRVQTRPVQPRLSPAPGGILRVSQAA